MNLPEPTESGLITGSDQTVRVVHSYKAGLFIYLSICSVFAISVTKKFTNVNSQRDLLRLTQKGLIRPKHFAVVLFSLRVHHNQQWVGYVEKCRL